MTIPTEDWSFEIAGVTIAALDSPLAYVSSSGLAASPELRSSSTPRAGDHGAYLGKSVYNSRQVSLSFELIADDDDGLMELVQAVRAVGTATDQDLPLTFKLPGLPAQVLYVRAQGWAVSLDESWVTSWPLATLEFEAPDPRIYSAEGHVRALPKGTATAVENAGSFEGKPVVTLTGPLTNPQLAWVSEDGISGSLAFVLTLGSGETLVIDARKPGVTRGSSHDLTDRELGSSWPVLRAGTTTMTLTADSGSGSGSISWQDAWI